MIGNCRCINKSHRIKLIKALENEIYKLDIEYKSMQKEKEKWDKSFQQGDVSVDSKTLLESIKQNKDSFQSTLNEINKINQLITNVINYKRVLN